MLSASSISDVFRNREVRTTARRERLALKRLGGEYAVLTHMIKQQK